jgi:uncharacterized membrane protein
MRILKFGINKMNKEKIVVHRTTEGTIFELAFLVLAVVVWVLVILMLKNAPDVIATHFDAYGRPNGYGSPWGLLFPCIIMTLTGAGLLLGAYFPHTFNVPVEVKSPRQYELLIRMTRIMALLFLLITLVIPATLLVFVNHPMTPVFIVIGLIFVVVIYYCVRINKAKEKSDITINKDERK